MANCIQLGYLSCFQHSVASSLIWGSPHALATWPLSLDSSSWNLKLSACCVLV